MVLKKIDVPWASTSSNVGAPSDAVIGNGHLLGTEASSPNQNFAMLRSDNAANAAAELAQAASQVMPGADFGAGDWVRLCGGMQHQTVNGSLFPNDNLCRAEMPAGGWRDSCVGRNPSTNRGCVFFIQSATDSVYRINTWDYGNITIDTLDLDLTNAESTSLRGLACDGSYLYTCYANSVTGNFHLIKLDLTNWTGLPVEERDTGWSYTPASGGLFNVTLALSRYDTLAAFRTIESTTAQFGIWLTDDSSWLTGAGNIGGLTGTVNITANRLVNVQSTWNQVYAVIQTSHDGGTYNQLNLVSCNVDDPTAATYPAAPAVIDYTSASDIMCGFRVFAGAIAIMTHPGRVNLIYEAGGTWYTLDKGYVSALDLDKETGVMHAPQIVADGSGRLWFMYFLENADTLDSSTSLVLVAFDPSLFRADMPDVTMVAKAVIPVGSYEAADGNELGLHWDGRSLVVLNDAGSTRYVRVLHNPGSR